MAGGGDTKYSWRELKAKALKYKILSSQACAYTHFLSADTYIITLHFPLSAKTIQNLNGFIERACHQRILTVIYHSVFFFLRDVGIKRRRLNEINSECHLE